MRVRKSLYRITNMVSAIVQSFLLVLGVHAVVVMRFLRFCMVCLLVQVRAAGVVI